MGAPLTGRKVFMITASAFAVIIAVNVFMAVKAVSTFPGLEVRNGYVASQSFDARRAAQEALGWTLSAELKNGMLILDFTDAEGRHVEPQDLTLLIGRTTESRDDIRPELTGINGTYTALVDLDYGKWMMVVEAKAEDGTAFQQRLDLFVKD